MQKKLSNIKNNRRQQDKKQILKLSKSDHNLRSTLFTINYLTYARGCDSTRIKLLFFSLNLPVAGELDLTVGDSNKLIPISSEFFHLKLISESSQTKQIKQISFCVQFGRITMRCFCKRFFCDSCLISRRQKFNK